MSSEEQELNPYSTPKETATTTKRIKKHAREEVEENDDSIIQDIIRSFQKTRSWVSFFAVLSRFSAAIFVMAGGVLALMAAREDEPIAALRLLVGLAYALMGPAAAILSWRLFRYRDAISNVIRSDGRLDYIADAVEQQARCWTLAGPMALVLFAIRIAYIMIGGIEE